MPKNIHHECTYCIVKLSKVIFGFTSCMQKFSYFWSNASLISWKSWNTWFSTFTSFTRKTRFPVVTVLTLNHTNKISALSRRRLQHLQKWTDEVGGCFSPFSKIQRHFQANLEILCLQYLDKPKKPYQKDILVTLYRKLTLMVCFYDHTCSLTSSLIDQYNGYTNINFFWLRY